jgi:hypothetical protein
LSVRLGRRGAGRVISMYRNRSKYLFAIIYSLAMVAVAQSAAANGPIPAVPGAPLASSFPGPLWEVVAPRGGTAAVSNQHLFLNVPGGSNHALIPSNQAVRVVQPVGNQDFDVSIKIDSPILATDESTSRGLMVLADDENFITFALITNGTHLGLSVHTYLRISRTGVAYLAYYSVDGVVWTRAASFADTSVPNFIGPFASNYNPNPSRAVPVVMAINWFNIL